MNPVTRTLIASRPNEPVTLPLTPITGSRRFYVVDIENAVGGPCPCNADVLQARAAIAAAYPTRVGDHVTIGVAHNGLLEVGCCWTGPRYVVRSGPDGAELALIDELDDWIIGRFDEVVVVSGDRKFADRVAELAARGLPTTVVAHRESLSNRLRMAASKVVYLESERRHGVSAADSEVA